MLFFFFACCHCRFISSYEGTCHTHKVQRLNESTSYAFRIQALNEAGSGPFSAVYTFATPRSPPAPLKGKLFPRATFFSVTFFFRIGTSPCLI